MQKNQSQVWDETGMTFRQWNNERNDFDPEQIKIINNQIVFSDDGFKSAKMAIGKIPIDKNGNTVYAVNAEAILGKLFLGEYLTLQNNSGTYKFDDSGFIAKSDNNSIKIQPNNDSEILSIYKGNQKQVYINSDGDVEFAGSLKSASGKFSGLVSGGEININNTFTVDKDGNVFANNGTFGGNCTFKGTLDGASGSFSGNVNASSGTIGGWNITDNGFSASSYYNGTSIYTNIIPGQILFYNSSNPEDYIFMNFNGIAFGNSLTSISKNEIFSRNIKCEELKFTGTSSGKITCDDFMTITFDTVNNVHFYNTPYIDSYNSYLAREEWCNDKFALRTDLSRYVTSSDLSEYATKAYVNSVKESIKSWVRSNFKSK